MDELVQRVHWQFTAQCAHLSQQALLQAFHPVQDTRTLQVSLKRVQGTWGWGKRVSEVAMQGQGDDSRALEAHEHNRSHCCV